MKNNVLCLTITKVNFSYETFAQPFNNVSNKRITEIKKLERKDFLPRGVELPSKHYGSRDTPPYRLSHDALLRFSDNPPTENNRLIVKTGTNDVHQRRLAPFTSETEAVRGKAKGMTRLGL